MNPDTTAAERIQQIKRQLAQFSLLANQAAVEGVTLPPDIDMASRKLNQELADLLRSAPPRR